MFARSLLDTTSNRDPAFRRLFNCVRLVSDTSEDIIPLVSTKWRAKEALRRRGVEPTIENDELVEDFRARLFPTDRGPRKICNFGYTSLRLVREFSENAAAPVATLKDEFFLSADEYYNRAALADQGLANTTVLILASAGVDIILPNIAVDEFDEEAIIQLREKYEQERVAYLNALTVMAHAAFDGLNAGSEVDVLRWARNEVAFKLVPKARAVERAARGAPARLLREAGFSFWRNGVPAIGSAYLSAGLVGAAKVGAEHLLENIVASVAKRREDQPLPEIGYIMKIKGERDQQTSREANKA